METYSDTFLLLGIPILNCTMNEALDRIQSVMERGVEAGTCREMHFVNAHCINVAYRDSVYLGVLQQAAAVFPDGSGIRRAGSMLGTEIRENVNGTDLFPELCSLCSRLGKKIYLLGAEPGTAEKVAEWTLKHTGKQIISGTHDGFFTEDTSGEVIDEINRSQPDLLLTAMGVPRQELWLNRHLHELHVPVCMGVGGLFDFYSGNIRRAPVWMRKAGIEWVWRLMMEPRRMWRRYIIGNLVFILRMRRLKHESRM